MNGHGDRITHLQEQLERLRHAQSVPRESPEAMESPDMPKVRLPRGPAEPSPNESELSTLLELLAVRDGHIHAELMRLQRALSRQTFRGAESARRLVRRLARRAEQNAADATQMRSRTSL
jgi:hypothetical protein